MLVFDFHQGWNVWNSLLSWIYIYIYIYIVRSHLLTLVPRSRIFLPSRWWRYVPPKRRFTQGMHNATTKKTAFFNNTFYFNKSIAFVIKMSVLKTWEFLIMSVCRTNKGFSLTNRHDRNFIIFVLSVRTCRHWKGSLINRWKKVAGGLQKWKRTSVSCFSFCFFSLSIPSFVFSSLSFPVSPFLYLCGCRATRLTCYQNVIRKANFSFTA
jgi:hypothetical protein